MIARFEPGRGEGATKQQRQPLNAENGTMGSAFDQDLALDFTRVDGTQPSPGRTDGVFTVVLPSAPTATEDEVLVAFESGDQSHDVDGRDFLMWQRGHQSGVDVGMETITIAHEGFELM